MKTLADALAQFEYPGRMILVGKDAGYQVAVYIVTGRNPASCAKGYVYDPISKTVGVQVTDEEIVSTGNRDLLVYTAMRFESSGVVVSNGSQGDGIAIYPGKSAQENLDTGLVEVSYEPDKYRTPRITGCIGWGETSSAALASVRSGQSGEVVRESFALSMREGVGSLVATYAGPNIRPTPSYQGGPIEVELGFGSADALAVHVWNELKRGEDLRVSVVVAYCKRGSEPRVAICNKPWGSA